MKDCHWSEYSNNCNQNDEVLTIEIGGSGIRIGHAWWRLLCQEHAIDQTGAFYGNEDQLLFLDNFFHEQSIGKYVPRTIAADFDNDELNNVASQEYSEVIFSY